MTTDAGLAMEAAGPLLARDPVRNHLVLRLLEERAFHPSEGRYFMVMEGGRAVGLLFQSPLTMHAALTPPPNQHFESLIKEVGGAAPELPGVFATASAASRFAGGWAELMKTPVVPVEAQRLYRLDALQLPRAASGHLRPAHPVDLPTVLAWREGFRMETDGHPPPDEVIEQRINAGEVFLWDDGGPVAMATITGPVAGVCGLSLVYTPPEHRRRGYAAHCTAGASEKALIAGALTCVLFTQLNNPQSNAIYRRLGYMPVEEYLRYRFG
jgi:GNAT superfamily N-acetyltransferase